MTNVHGTLDVYGTLDVAARLGISVRTVRNWDRHFERFLPTTRDEHGVRAYQEETVRRFEKICVLRDKGFSLPVIGEMLEVFYGRQEAAGSAVAVSVSARPPASPMVDQFLDRMQSRLEDVSSRHMTLLRDHLDHRFESLSSDQRQILDGIATIRTPRRERHRRRPLWKRLFRA